MDSNYNVIVNYKYDAYGNIISITDNEGKEITDLNHIAYINPFRYRSYYYDEETKLYYLNSRYYNPSFGRFINADGTIGANDDIISHNLFAYVSNNPINKVDVNGNYADALPAVGGFLGGAAKASASTSNPAGLFVAGALAIASLVCYGIYELTKPKTVAIPDARFEKGTDTKGTKIYRSGTTNYQLTPRAGDNDGLSFSTYPNLGPGKYTVTTIELVNSTPNLKVECNSPTHCVVKPKYGTIDEWMASKLVANERPHQYTITLKSISWIERIE